MTDGFGTQTYQYDLLSQLTQEGRQFPVGTLSISYSYNLGGQLTGLTDPFGASFTFTRDLQGQLKSLTGSPFGGVTSYVTDINYRAFGEPKSITYASTNSTIAYNARMLPTQFRLTANGSGNSVIREDYGYWSDGNVATLTDLDDTGGSNPPSTLRFLSRAYGYDHVGRIASGQGNGGGGIAVPFIQNYGYDAFGNMTSRGGSYYNYMNANPTFTDSATYTNNRRSGWSYNANGQVTSTPASTTDQARTMTYDAAGNLISTVETGSSTTTTYTAAYDGDGEVCFETSTTSPGTSESAYFVRSTVLDGEVLTRVGPTGTKKITHVPTFGLLIAKQVVNQGSEGVGITHRNPLGTTESGKGVVDPLGNYIPFQAMGDPRPPAGSYTSATLRGLSASLANPHAYGNGCLLDGSPVNCSLAMRLLNNGSAERCEQNDCGPRVVDGRLQPLRLTAAGYAFWIDQKPKLSQANKLPAKQTQQQRKRATRKSQRDAEESGKREEPRDPKYPPVTEGNINIVATSPSFSTIRAEVVASIIDIANNQKCSDAFKKWGLKIPYDVVLSDHINIVPQAFLVDPAAAQTLGISQQRINDAAYDLSDGFFFQGGAAITLRGAGHAPALIIGQNITNPKYLGIKSVIIHEFIHAGGRAGSGDGANGDLTSFDGYKEIQEACGGKSN